MTRRATLALPLLLMSACAGNPKISQLTGRWIGDVTPTTGGVFCQKSRGVAQVKNGEMIFAPDEGTWVLTGTATPDGVVSADKIGQGVNKKPFPTTLEGKWTETSIAGTYKTPRCTFDVQLTRR